MTGAEEVGARFVAALARAAGSGSPRGAGLLSVACVQVLPVTRAAIMIWTGPGGWEMLGASDSEAADYAQLEAATGEGPGPQAHRHQAPVLVPDVAAALGAGRWPLLAAAGFAHKDGGVFAFPLQLGAIRVGTLDLYADTMLDKAGFAAAVQVAELITTLLLSATPDPRPELPEQHRADAIDVFTHAINDSYRLGSWWEPAQSTREIHQATGMIAAQLGTDITTAYARLVGFALAASLPIAQVSADVVAHRVLFRPDDGSEPDPGPS
ncbi:hypothetical protein [Nocardia sp. NBC_01327]|uniref:hypothetical protein n=1 Tax=Nocardia sp. NBC_01327 TaxID=2903593 RepID=UPI002E0ECD29|nr:hypothetical protein OG326_16335 [Nocardia sp. NBC_01327]